MSPNQNPEQVARDAIDAQLRASGWAVQAKDVINFHEAEGQAVREYSTDTGPADYVLFVDGQPVGVIEAKKETLGHTITVAEDQTADYAAAKLKWVQSTGIPLPFLYEATGIITRFTDQRDPRPRSREVFRIHRPETLRSWLASPAPGQPARSLRARLHDLPALDPAGLRDCQIEAVANLETSLKAAKPRALVQMATGAGKTFTAITSVYRLLKHARVRRVLFLVDTRNLGEQAEQEFLAFTPSDDNRKFTELYSAQRLASSHVPADAQVCISTIQRMYSILQGTELDESAEDENPAEHSSDRRREPLPVAYNAKVPPEFFDLIIIDECHRSIYNLWRQVLDYFDAFLVGLTATPDARTYGFFHQNVVSEYTHEDAVADGVNVQGEIYTIETEVSQQGGTVLKGLVEKREKLTRAKRWQQQDEDQAYSAKKLDRDIVNPSQIRTVIRAFRDRLPEIFPDRTDAAGAYEVPKTLIFAKTDSHADDIINIVREEFGEGNAFCKKVTFGTTKGVKRITFDPADDSQRHIEDDYIQEPETAKSVLSQFRNGYHPRIAVTVDMIATGTDVKPLECLLFMRDVKSKGYFEQMKGRGTRTLDLDGLRKVSSAAKSGKTHYVIVDAIGVTKSLKTASRPPVTRPTVPFKDLAMEVVMGASDADTVSSLAGRLARIERQLTPLQKHQIAQKLGGVPIGQLVKNLFHAIDGEAIEQRALALVGQPAGTDPGDAAREKAQQQLVAAARAPLTGAAVTLIVETCTANLQTIDHDTQDRLLAAGWDGDIHERAAAFAQDFESFCRDHRDQLDALTIYYTQPQRRQEVTLAHIKDVLAALRQHAPRLAPLRVWDAYARLDELPANARPLTELTALIALLRRACGIDQKLTPFADTVRRNYRDWIVRENAGNPFTAAQTAWLQLIRDHVMTSFRLDREDLEYAPFDAQGGLGKMYQLFGDRMDPLIAELNKELTA
ncbi:type I restriction-modification enzyme R subunit C-terminal domain-containing protein [Opitutales bacterium ASA1]|uniref:type I restriction endonuclease subunit R n=1 Tax=Congregicoccus parvus TaxID=3081749 RepID=UPI002B314340|nr:type I restriction-modification enzyme R subunit C-terminal domain-containing protein [Opitutales bacterium ASA1]